MQAPKPIFGSTDFRWCVRLGRGRQTLSASKGELLDWRPGDRDPRVPGRLSFLGSCSRIALSLLARKSSGKRLALPGIELSLEKEEGT